MKKLMFIAALAAVVGSASAATIIDRYNGSVFDFNATIKSVGMANSKQVTYKVSVCRNESGHGWWEKLGCDNAKDAMKAFNAMDNFEKFDFVQEDLGYRGVAASDPYDNDYRYFDDPKTDKFTTLSIKFYGLAYTVAKTYKLKEQVLIQYEDPSFAHTQVSILDNEELMLFIDDCCVIGGSTYQTSKQKPIVGMLTDGVNDLYIAGMGSLDAQKYLTSVSGSIAGKMDPAIAGGYAGSVFVYDAGITYTMGNAFPAYGTFTLKYNKKATQKYQDELAE